MRSTWCDRKATCARPLRKAPESRPSSRVPRAATSRGFAHFLGSLALLCSAGLLVLFAASARAQIDEAPEGVAANGLCGLLVTSAPVCKQRVAIAASAGYGYTESLGLVPGAHHRLPGTLAVGVVPLPYLAVSLRLDGRLDLHPRDDIGRDYTGTGEPRLSVRSGREFGRSAFGGELIVWVPGSNAPSFEARATTVDLKALFAQRFARARLLANVGVRLDQSEKSAPEPDRLRAGDRMALGLSDYHALLLAVGAQGPLLSRAEWFAEASVDWLLGSDAPPFAKSPLRVTLGARAFMSARLSLELSVSASAQQRPALDGTSPLIPIEPRFTALAGLRYAWDLYPKLPPPPVREEPVEVAQPTTATVAGVLLDEQGAPLPDVRLVLRTKELERETVTDGEGRYSFADVPVGAAVLEGEATGFAAGRWELEVRPYMEPLPARALAAKGDVGTLRVLTRSFESTPLAANVIVRDARGRKVAGGEADAEGRYQVDVPPGEYVVTISAPGYRQHRREVRIERYGVAILNVDLHAQK